MTVDDDQELLRNILRKVLQEYGLFFEEIDGKLKMIRCDGDASEEELLAWAQRAKAALDQVTSEFAMATGGRSIEDRLQ